ncbi:MAG: DNA-directed RNA polymerase subunit omega [Acutalibacteraceae bacterium]
MLNPDLRLILKEHTSRYSLVRAVAKRAREITSDDVLREKCGDEKPVTVALEEFLDGKLEIIEPEEIRDI